MLKTIKKIAIFGINGFNSRQYLAKSEFFGEQTEIFGKNKVFVPKKSLRFKIKTFFRDHHYFESKIKKLETNPH